MGLGSQNFKVEFLRVNRQFNWLETSLTYDRSDKNTIIYDSYNVEKGAIMIKSLELENILETYSLTNEMKYNINNKIKKFLFKHFFAWNCDGCFTALVQIIFIILTFKNYQ